MLKKDKRDSKDINSKITFVTAAYGPRYHKFVKGLVKTFSINNADSLLVIYSDVQQLNIATTQNYKIDNSISSKKMLDYSKDLPLRSAKHLILLDAAEKYKNICWIDADMLVFTDLSNKIEADKINVISYGFGRKLRKCGAGLKVPQYDYCLGGIFYCPSHYIIKYEKLWRSLREKIKKETKLFDQSTLNHLVKMYRDKTIYLNKRYKKTIWNFEKYRTSKKSGKCHPSNKNAYFCQKLTYKNNKLIFNNVPVSIHCWTSGSLNSHLKTNFKRIKDQEAREFLQGLYS